MNGGVHKKYYLALVAQAIYKVKSQFIERYNNMRKERHSIFLLYGTKVTVTDSGS